MQRLKVDKTKLPEIDDKPVPGAVYISCSWKAGKQSLTNHFIELYNADPAQVFFGKPNGSVLYAGPVPGSEPAPTAEKLQPNQPTLFPQE